MRQRELAGLGTRQAELKPHWPERWCRQAPAWVSPHTHPREGKRVGARCRGSPVLVASLSPDSKFVSPERLLQEPASRGTKAGGEGHGGACATEEAPETRGPPSGGNTAAAEAPPLAYVDQQPTILLAQRGRPTPAPTWPSSSCTSCGASRCWTCSASSCMLCRPLFQPAIGHFLGLFSTCLWPLFW